MGAACVLYKLVILSALQTSGSNLLVLQFLLKFKQPRGCAYDCIGGLGFYLFAQVVPLNQARDFNNHRKAIYVFKVCGSHSI